jgi:hypothetical protein
MIPHEWIRTSCLQTSFSAQEEEEEEEQEEEINTCERLSALWLHFACGAYLEYFL